MPSVPSVSSLLIPFPSLFLLLFLCWKDCRRRAIAEMQQSIPHAGIHLSSFKHTELRRG